MGAVYLARELALDRLVAIKVLPPDASEDSERRARFRREAQLAAKLSHPNIVPLHSFGEKGELLYYLMGYVRGESLAERLRRDGRISHAEGRTILALLADALEYAHRKGVIHRDIKPDNILLDDETGQPLLADFGIARATSGATHVEETAGVVGTLHYMSPEQAAGASTIDGRSDLYSLGVVGYVMLAGRTPFAAATFGEFVREQAHADPPPLLAQVTEVPSDLAIAIMRCLFRDAALRWPDARAFKDALGAALDDDPDRLPGELREVAGALLYSVTGGWVIANGAALLLPTSTQRWLGVLLLSLVIAAAYAATAIFHNRNGFKWAELRRVSLWPPAWWPFWWPGSWRRPGDVWVRLPPAVRAFRTLYGAVAAVLFLALPLAVRPARLPMFVVFLGIAQVVVTALMLSTAWWAYRASIPNNADLRSLILRSTTDRRFWKRPQMARRLLPPPVRPLKSPETPAEYVRHMVETTQRMTGRAQETAAKAVEVARVACAALDRLDDELGQLEKEVDVPDAEMLEQRRNAIIVSREHVFHSLKALWAEHIGLLRDESDPAIQRLTGMVRSFAHEVAAQGTHDEGGDSATIGPTTTEGTGLAHRPE